MRVGLMSQLPIKRSGRAIAMYLSGNVAVGSPATEAAHQGFSQQLQDAGHPTVEVSH